MQPSSKFETLKKGTRAIRRVPLPLVNTPAPFTSDLPELAEARERDEQTDAVGPEVGIRVLTGDEQLLVYEKCWADAKARGCEKPDEKDPIYALCESVWTLALACVDPDSDPASPALFFGKTPAEAAANIRSTPHLGRDGIAYLCEQQATWQDMVHPQAGKVDEVGLARLAAEAASTDDVGFFLSLRLALRWTLLRFTAVQATNSLLDKSPTGGSFGSGGAESSAASASP